MSSNVKQSYQKKRITKGGALIFGLGLGALFATAAIIAGMAIPSVSTRLENVPLYARTYYRKLFPPPQYLPTPAPTVSTPVSPTQGAIVPAATAIPTFPLTAMPTSVIETPEVNAVITATVETETSTPEPTIEVETGAETTAEPTSLLENEEAAPVTLVELQPMSDRGDLTGFVHQWQTWNNCGPATITMYTSYFSRPETQVEAAQFLKPNRDDKNVSPQELAAYARTLGLEVMVRQGGSLDQLKTFLSNGLPVLAETWLVHDGDGLGHYRLVTGYDDSSRQLNTFDSLNGPNYKAGYEQFDSDWRVFNRLYLVIYTPEQAPLVATLIGEEMNDTAMHEKLVQQSRAEIEANPNDAIAHFNLGDSLTQLGRYQEAVAAFDQARTLGLHWRRLWYQFTPFEAYYAVGRYQDVLDLADATLRNSGGLEEVYYYQGLALQATGQPGAAQAFEAAIAYNPNFAPAKEALENVSNP